MPSVASDLGRGPRSVLVLLAAVCLLSAACAPRRDPFQYMPMPRIPVSGGPVCIVTSFETDRLPRETRALFDRNFGESLVVALRGELSESHACGSIQGIPDEPLDVAALEQPADPVQLSVSVWSGGWYLTDQDAHDEVRSLLATISWVIDPLLLLPTYMYYSSQTTLLHGVAQLVVEVSSASRNTSVVRSYVGESVSVRTNFRAHADESRRLAFEEAYLDALQKLRADLPAAVDELQRASRD